MVATDESLTQPLDKLPMTQQSSVDDKSHEESDETSEGSSDGSESEEFQPEEEDGREIFAGVVVHWASPETVRDHKRTFDKFLRLGGENISRITRRVQLLVAGRSDASSSKIERAKESKIPVVKADLFEYILSHNNIRIRNKIPRDLVDRYLFFSSPSKRRSSNRSSDTPNPKRGHSTESGDLQRDLSSALSLAQQLVESLEGLQSKMDGKDSAEEDESVEEDELSNDAKKPKKSTAIPKVTSDKKPIENIVMGVVESQVPQRNRYQVATEGGGVWDCELLFSDSKEHIDKFYRMQLLNPVAAGGKILLWTRWGRRGAAGRAQEKKFTKLTEGKDAFRERFYEKTGNEWKGNLAATIKAFGRVGGKYGVNAAASTSKSTPTTVTPSSRLHPSLTLLMTTIGDVKSALTKKCSLDLDVSQIQNFTVDKLLPLYKILEEIAVALQQDQTSSSALIRELSNKFYAGLPSRGTSPAIDSQMKLRTAASLLEYAMDFAEMDAELPSPTSDGQSAQSLYKHLQCEAAPLPPDDEILGMTKEYAQEEKSKIKILHVFELSRKRDEAAFSSYVHSPNRFLLWYGVPLISAARVLLHGVRFPRQSVPSAALNLGHSAIFFDTIDEAVNLCAKTKNGHGVLFLCEVAMGQQEKTTISFGLSSLPDGKDSILGVGQFQPPTDEWSNFDDGLQIPLGIAKETTESEFKHSHYFIFNPDRVCVRYAVLVEFL